MLLFLIHPNGNRHFCHMENSEKINCLNWPWPKPFYLLENVYIYIFALLFSNRREKTFISQSFSSFSCFFVVGRKVVWLLCFIYFIFYSVFLLNFQVKTFLLNKFFLLFRVYLLCFSYFFTVEGWCDFSIYFMLSPW